MLCIYCVTDFSPDSLTKEHVIPKSLGGPLVLEKAVCSDCGKITKKLDDFLANTFPPKLMARSELDIRSYSKAQPKMLLMAEDPELGQVEMVLQGENITVKPTRRREGDSLLTIAPSLDEVLIMISKANKRHKGLSNVNNMGVIRATTAKIIEPIDWEFAHRAASKIFYCYLLFELGDQILDKAQMRTLRKHFLRSSDDSQIPVDTNVAHIASIIESEQSAIPLEVPRHHHILSFDSQYESNNWVCLFGLFWFKFHFDLSELSPHGRLIGINPISHTLVESMTRYQGTWRFRTSILWDWQRRLNTRYEIPISRNLPNI